MGVCVCFVCCYKCFCHRRIFISFRCRFTLGAYRPEESKQRLLCFFLEWHFLILTVLLPISHHHPACHLVHSSPRHHFLSLSIASSTSPHFILYLCPSSAVFCLRVGAGLARAMEKEKKEWRFEQASRLEIRRHKEKEKRDSWFQQQAERYEEYKQAEWAAAKEWEEWWWSEAAWGADWWTQGEAKGSGWHAEPTAKRAPTSPPKGGASSSTSTWVPKKCGRGQRSAAGRVTDSSQLHAAALDHNCSWQASDRTQRVCKSIVSVYSSYMYWMKMISKNNTWSHVWIMFLMAGIFSCLRHQVGVGSWCEKLVFS